MKARAAFRFYGRHRHVPDGVEPGRQLEGLHRARLAAIARGAWPSSSLAAWREIAADPTHVAHRRALEVLAAAAAAGIEAPPA